jgi:hypothetical protein
MAMRPADWFGVVVHTHVVHHPVQGVGERGVLEPDGPGDVALVGGPGPLHRGQHQPHRQGAPGRGEANAVLIHATEPGSWV